MYEDSWYSFVPEVTAPKKETPSSPGHRRKESLLQQPNAASPAIVDAVEPLDNLYEAIENSDNPPEATVLRRAASYSDFYDLIRAQISKDEHRKSRQADRKERQWGALMLGDEASALRTTEEDNEDAARYSLPESLLRASQEDYTFYHDQLQLTERHLDSLIDDANTTLKLLNSLTSSFKSVETQTLSFQSHCEDLLSEQRRLEKLADDVGTDLHYYAYLDTATRRLNAPGASRLVEDDIFGEIVGNIEACIGFMNEHENYRDRDQYLARYNALLTKALHLLDHGFTTRLDKIVTEISRQISATQYDSARHALAYGRFEEMIMDSYSLIPNIQSIVRCVYDQYGRPMTKARDMSTYSTAIGNIFRTYLTTRDRVLKIIAQHDIEEYKKEVQSLSPETASRNFIKQCFERASNEDSLFIKIFNTEPGWNTIPSSAFQIIKAINTSMVHPGNLSPLGTALQSTLQTADLQAICNVAGWLASEYSIAEIEDDESPVFRKYREYAARVLVDHLWPSIDKAFEVEITKSLTKAALLDAALEIGPVTDGLASSNAYPLVKRAVELLAMFDHAMPKERSSKNSPVVFKIVRETIQVLQKAEARIKYLKKATDPDLFMIKNLLLVKNELVSLEIGDIRAESSMQHFGRIWDTLSPSNWVGYFSSVIGSSLWSRGSGGGNTPKVTAKTLTVEDMNEQLDELLRQSIYAFTQRWMSLMTDSRARKAGVKPIAKVEAELETLLQAAFSNQPEVIAKLKEAIELSAQNQDDGKQGKKTARR